jgi:hypothetical protein
MQKVNVSHGKTKMVSHSSSLHIERVVRGAVSMSMEK